MKKIVLYNGAGFCENCENCPVVEHFADKGIVKISDPAKPENGAFAMTVAEYNALLANARKV